MTSTKPECKCPCHGGPMEDGCPCKTILVWNGKETVPTRKPDEGGMNPTQKGASDG